MKRVRGRIAGGYVRKTLSLPASIVNDLQALIDKQPGTTMSVLMTVAADEYITKQKRRA